ncbi:MAG: hypothetical protein FJ263_03650 [Planctomycetes bacterium]|nr:hypothetical protein [Planctomycetota bacterium]
MHNREKMKNAPIDDNAANDIFILAHDGQHQEFSRELIRKTNERFEWTGGYIPYRNTGLVEYVGILQRSGLATTIANDSQLRSYNVWPLTPFQSNEAVKNGNLPQHDKFAEDMAWVLYDTQAGQYSFNLQEANALKKSILEHRDDLKLSKGDLEERLLITNAGLEKDTEMPYGVKPVIIPGITHVCSYRTLNADPDHFINKDDKFHGVYSLRRERYGRPPQRGVYLSYAGQADWMVKINPEWSENVCYLETSHKEAKKANPI